MLVWTWVFAIPISYALGSIPSGIIAGRLLAGVDIRSYGSRSSGATNMARTLGSRAGILVLVLDLAKGAGAIFLTAFFSGEDLLVTSFDDMTLPIALSGTMAVIGHLWPIWVKFKGGKGVATGLGALFVISPFGGIAALIGISVAIVTRYVSLGSLIGTWLSSLTIIGLIIAGFHDITYLVFSIPVTILITWRHRENIKRIITRTEKPLTIQSLPISRKPKTNPKKPDLKQEE